MLFKLLPINHYGYKYLKSSFTEQVFVFIANLIRIDHSRFCDIGLHVSGSGLQWPTNVS